MTASGAAAQAKVTGPDKWGVAIYRCSRHDNIDYRVKGSKPVCPLCEELKRSELLRQELKKVTNANDLLKRDLIKARSQLSALDGMREAVTELGPEDGMFLKEMVYRYRANPKQVKVSQKIVKRQIRVEGAGTAVRHEVVGFVVEYRDGEEPEFRSHAATSIGGKMIALQFSETLKMSGVKGAMEALMKAMASTMANADG